MPARRLTILDDHPPTYRRSDRASPAGGRGPGRLAALLDVGHAVTPPRAALASSTPEIGDSMSQQQFAAFMADQIAAIEASGVAPDVWVQRHSAAFRAAWEDSRAA
jgi:hypothetical protein